MLRGNEQMLLAGKGIDCPPLRHTSQPLRKARRASPSGYHSRL